MKRRISIYILIMMIAACGVLMSACSGDESGADAGNDAGSGAEDEATYDDDDEGIVTNRKEAKGYDEEKDKVYEEAVSCILKDDEAGFKQAAKLLGEIPGYFDADTLKEYANLRASINDYIGDPYEYYSLLSELDGVTDDVQDQLWDHEDALAEVLELQENMDMIMGRADSEEFYTDLDDDERIELAKETKSRIENSKDPYLFLLDPKQAIKDCNKVMK